MGLLPDDSECRQTLTKAFQPSLQPLAELFSILTAHCHPVGLKDIFDTHQEIVILDPGHGFCRKPKLSNEQLALQYVLAKIQGSLSTMSSNLHSEYGLAPVQADLPQLTDFTQGQNPKDLCRLVDASKSSFNSFICSSKMCSIKL